MKRQTKKSPDTSFPAKGEARQGRQLPVKTRKVAFLSLFLVLSCWCLVTWCSGDFAFADEIKIRTIVTPIGSQSEKWGAAGLMVCVVGDRVEDGGCGWAVAIDGYEDEDLVIFKDENDNHEYDAGDKIYDIVGKGGAGEFPEEACMWVKDGCPDGWTPKLAPPDFSSSSAVKKVLLATLDCMKGHEMDCCPADTDYFAVIDSWTGCPPCTMCGCDCTGSCQGATYTCLKVKCMKYEGSTYYWCCPK